MCLTAIEHPPLEVVRLERPDRLGIVETSTPFCNSAAVMSKSGGSNAFCASNPIGKKPSEIILQRCIMAGS